MGNFEFESGKSYFMPVHFGPLTPGWDGLTVHYERAVGLVFAGEIEPSAVAPYLPPGFTAAEPAILSVRYLQLSGCVLLAGGGYNVVSVDVSARFDGEEDHLEGDYALMQWESSSAPVIAGRELAGAPKLVADIPGSWSLGGTKGWYVSENSFRLAEGEVSQLRKLGAKETQALSARIRSRPWLGWKHIPTANGTGTDVSYPTAFSSRLNVTEAWSGRGTVRFFEASFAQAPQNSRVSAVLGKLPVPGEGDAIMLEGSLDLPVHEWRRLR